MEIIDAMGKPCPIPVIEAKKALAREGSDSILVMVDNIVAVQNLEKMARGSGYGFSYEEKSPGAYDVAISLNGQTPPARNTADSVPADMVCTPTGRLVVVISRDTMGEGAEELGKILIKGFIYSLTELPVAPAAVIFLNSGAFLTTEGANTIEDIKKLEEKGTTVLTCGTCANYYDIQNKLAVGTVTNMYGITEQMAAASNVINI